MKAFAAGTLLVALATVGAFAGLLMKEDSDRANRYREGIREVRATYPFVSLEARLPPAPARASFAVDSELKGFEIDIDNDSYDRHERLQRLHEGSLEEFVRREGFGAARMLGGYGESLLANFGRGKTSVPQPRSAHFDTSLDVELEAAGSDGSGLLGFHRRNAVHFANPSGFGFMKDRRHVAGFQAHQFNELPESQPWKVERIELVGLLKETQPRVYVTEELPRMETIAEIPTRELDAFETSGLAKLQAGGHLFFRAASPGIRMLGAVRSVEQCVKCHGGERGDLLGAFSYSLTRVTVESGPRD